MIIWHWIFEYLRDLAQHIREYEVGKNENWNSHFRNFRLISSRQPRCWCCTSQFREIDEALGKYNSGRVKKNEVQTNRKEINFFVYVKIAAQAKPEGFYLVTCVSQKYLYSGLFLLLAGPNRIPWGCFAPRKKSGTCLDRYHHGWQSVQQVTCRWKRSFWSLSTDLRTLFLMC